jgi:hypothetical protein
MRDITNSKSAPTTAYSRNLAHASKPPVAPKAALNTPDLECKAGLVPGTQLTCCNGTKVQILTLLLLQYSKIPPADRPGRIHQQESLRRPPGRRARRDQLSNRRHHTLRRTISISVEAILPLCSRLVVLASGTVKLCVDIDIDIYTSCIRDIVYPRLFGIALLSRISFA